MLAIVASPFASSSLGATIAKPPRKANEEKDIKLSDVSAYLLFSSKYDFDFSMEYYLSRATDKSINVYIMLYCKTSRKETLFLETLGENPLNFEQNPEIEKWGRIMYCSVINVNDDDAVGRISELYRKAYTEVQRFMK